MGAKLVFDYRDAMPDQYVSKYNLPWKHPLVVMLRLVERVSILFCDHVVTVHEPYRRLAQERGASPNEISIFMNFPDPGLFDRDQHAHSVKTPGRFLLVYHGTVAPRFDLDTLLRAAYLLRPQIPELEVQILGSGDALEPLRALARELDLEHVVSLPGHVHLDDIPARISQADVGVAPAKPDKLEDLVLSTKLLEFMAMGKPAIASRRSIILDYVGEEAVRYYTSEDAADLAEQIECLYRDPAERRRLVDAGDAFMSRHSWNEIKREYLGVMRRLSNRASGCTSAADKHSQLRRGLHST
jgi:glycosyltransferase involved in cell wall biosynthesis